MIDVFTTTGSKLIVSAENDTLKSCSRSRKIPSDPQLRAMVFEVRPHASRLLEMQNRANI